MRHFLIMLAIWPLAFLGFAGAAWAGLTFCNDSETRATVAIGYKGAEDWTSEGWWAAEPGDCITVIEGVLPLDHYYWRATNAAGAFAAQHYYFCVSDEAFTIVGDRNCDPRGHRRERFSEIVVGPGGEATVLLAAATAPSDDVDFDKMQSALQGRWQDASDTSFVTVFEGSGFVDSFAGIEIASGKFAFAKTCDGAEGAGPVMLVSYEDLPEERLCWVIRRLDEGSFIFQATGVNKPVRYERE